MEKFMPKVGEKLYTYTPCNNYYVQLVRRPYTVESINKGIVIIRSARPVFYGDVYYDTLPDEIVDDPNGDKMRLKWNEKRGGWYEYPINSYPQKAVFGDWDYVPYLD